MSNVEKSDIEGDGDPFSMPYLNYNYSGKVATCKSEEGQLQTEDKNVTVHQHTVAECPKSILYQEVRVVMRFFLNKLGNLLEVLIFL